MIESFLIALTAAVLTAAFLFWLLRNDSILLAKDMPSSRGLHQRVVPRGGGLAIFAVVTLLAALGYLNGTRDAELTLVTVASLVGVAVMGFLDDRFNLSVSGRFLAGFAFTALLAAGSLADQPVLMFGQEYNLSSGVLVVVGALSIFWLMNLFNFMDGADGVAGVQSLVASAVLAFWYASEGQEFLALVNSALAGACLGFLWVHSLVVLRQIRRP